ncbi:MAG: S8 family peptidase [Halarsenatibacteraceae bacterium]
MVNGDGNKLPIKVVMSREQDKVKNTSGGGTKFFGKVTPKLRKSLAYRFSGLNNFFEHNFKEYPEVPCVGKIKVKENAIAKSHKPNNLLNEETCPIIGSDKLDEILIKLTYTGINNIINEILKNENKNFKANLTVIDDIIPYDENDKFKGVNKKSIFKKIDSREAIKIKLFNFNDSEDNEKSEKYFIELIEELGLRSNLEEIEYTSLFKIYKLKNFSDKALNKIISYNSIKNISPIKSIHSAPIKTNKIKKLDDKNFSLPDEEKDYPIVAVVDSGISEKNKILEPWVCNREVFVAEEYQNNSHGTFVAGMIQYGDTFNDFKSNSEQRFKLLDVIVIPNDDSNHGEVDTLTEDQFVEILREVVPKYHQEVKIWNLSLGSDIICKNDEISDLAVLLDELSDRYNVRFVLSSGNYVGQTIRSWPPDDFIGEQDRITTPAESVRSITVGSIAHKDSSLSIVNKFEPSPFSRRGPGSNFIIKPEVVDFGGNLDVRGNFTGLGVCSLDEDCNLIENVGTSFSAPLVSKSVAIINNSIESRDLLLSKALLVHSARLSDTVNIINRDENKYYGFGHPDIISSEVLNCSDDKVTLIFDENILQGEHLELYDFPYPESLLRNGKWFGEISMTLAYDPPLDPNFGQEYCRVNINASLGTYERSEEDDRLIYSRKVPLEKSWDEKYERARVENGFKWSPIKSYYRNIPRGIKDNKWKLRVDFLNRNEDKTEKQRFVLIITIVDSEGEDIYSDVINQLRLNGFEFKNLSLSQQVRQSFDI